MAALFSSKAVAYLWPRLQHRSAIQANLGDIA